MTETAPKPMTDTQAIKEIQVLFDGELLGGGVNLVTKKATCDWTTVEFGRTVKCTHRAVFQDATKHPCGECERSIKTVNERYCLAHGIDKFGRHLRPESLQMELITPEAPAARHVHETTVDGQAARVVTEGEPAETEAAMEAIVDGTTGAVSMRAVAVEVAAVKFGPATHVGTLPSPGDSEYCVCGWWLPSPATAAQHDTRHQKFVALVRSGDAEACEALRLALEAVEREGMVVLQEPDGGVRAVDPAIAAAAAEEGAGAVQDAPEDDEPIQSAAPRAKRTRTKPAGSKSLGRKKTPATAKKTRAKKGASA